eukprot:TRINITY_DN26304_c0_g1_i1.p1 TRINITY_DN26304_c0_g1~~TRINITY_DN26304_c0_g1_i1.p1  ORF type:complete len:554 (-),score=83.90 TRINITY_DN26304_c0_g1_i1:306-1829(-)
MAMYVEQFAEAGIFESLCPDSLENITRSSKYCQKQYMTVASIFSNGQMLTLIGQLPVGLLYDKYGPRVLGVAGAAGVLGGMLLLQVPILGAQYGADSSTSVFFPIAFVIADFASSANSYCLLGLIYHFPGLSTFVISLWMATYQAAAFQPMLLDGLMKLGCSFAVAMQLMSLSVAFGVLLCWWSAPSQKEYFDAAKVATGVPLPKPPKSLALCKAMRESNEVIWAFKVDFSLMALAIAGMFQFVMLYQGMAAAWGHLVFGSEAAGRQLAELFVVSTAVVGGIVAPGGAIVFDRYGLKLMVFTLLFIMIVANATVAILTWTAQTVCTLGLVIASTLFFTFITKLSTCYCTANRLGMVQSSLTVYCMVMCLIMYRISSSFAASSPDSVSIVRASFLASASTGTLCVLAYSIRFSLVGMPEMPALPKVDERDLCEPFGCVCFEEVLYISHMSDKRQVYEILSGPVEVVHKFALNLDWARLAEVSKKNGIPMPSWDDTIEGSYHKAQQIGV